MNTNTLTLQHLYNKNIMGALLTAGLIHIILIGGYTLYSLKNKDVIEFPRIINKPTNVFLPPPSIENRQVFSQPFVSSIKKISLFL